MKLSPSWNLTVAQLFKKLLGAWRSITRTSLTDTGSYPDVEGWSRYPLTTTLRIIFKIMFPFMPRSSSWPRPSEFPIRISCALLISPTRNTRPTNPSIHDLIIQIILDENYNLSSLLSFPPCRYKYSPQHPVLYSLPLRWITKFHTHTVDHSGRAVWSMKCLRSLEHWDRGFQSHSRHGSLFAFILCLC
jgi:hypothetical protein